MRHFIAHIQGGIVQNGLDARKAFADLRDGYYRVEIKSNERRSLDQNAYFHGVVLPRVREGLRNAGWDEIYTDEDAKDFIRGYFIRKEIVNKVTGEVKEQPGHTSHLTKLEFFNMIEAIIKWGAEYLDIQIPYPNEYGIK